MGGSPVLHTKGSQVPKKFLQEKLCYDIGTNPVNSGALGGGAKGTAPP